jgi:hypothetical protein
MLRLESQARTSLALLAEVRQGKARRCTHLERHDPQQEEVKGLVDYP